LTILIGKTFDYSIILLVAEFVVLDENGLVMRRRFYIWVDQIPAKYSKIKNLAKIWS